MNKSVHKVLLPLLIINYMFGLRIVQLPISLKPWFGFFYILMLWSLYYFLRVYITMIYFEVNVHFMINELADLTLLLSILFGMYHNKKFINCLKKMAAVNTTLEKLGISTNYQQLHKQIIWIILGWFVITILLNNVPIEILKKKLNCNTMTAFYISYLCNHCVHINFLSDLTMTSIIGYIGIKFDQINEHLKNMANNNKYRMTKAWNNIMLHTPQQQFAKTSSNKWMIWIIIQLHLELRRISRELDTIYGVETTFKMGCYFILMSIAFNNIFHVIFIRNYTNNTVIYSTVSILWCSHNILRFLIINLMCEKVSSQANSTKHFLNKILYHSTNDMETCENISQLLLHIKQSPLRFCGIGLFQFGYKFIYGFVSSAVTVLVILIQAHVQTKNMLKNI